MLALCSGFGLGFTTLCPGTHACQSKPLARAHTGPRQAAARSDRAEVKLPAPEVKRPTPLPGPRVLGWRVKTGPKIHPPAGLKTLRLSPRSESRFKIVATTCGAAVFVDKKTLDALWTLWTLWTLQVRLYCGSTVYHFWCPPLPLQSCTLQSAPDCQSELPVPLSRWSLLSLAPPAPRHHTLRVIPPGVS